MSSFFVTGFHWVLIGMGFLKLFGVFEKDGVFESGLSYTFIHLSQVRKRLVIRSKGNRTFSILLNALPLTRTCDVIGGGAPSGAVCPPTPALIPIP